MRFKSIRYLGLVSALASLAAAAAYAGDPVPSQNPAQILTDAEDGDDWAAFGRTYDERHFSPLSQIGEANVANLKLAWFHDLPTGNSVSGPLAVDGVLYTATGYSVVRAFEADTGKMLWEHDTGATGLAGNKMHQGWGIRGLAYWDGMVFVGTHDGRLVALDTRDGSEVWSQMTVGKDDVRFISGPPRVFDGKVIIGHGGADVGPIRGYVTTFDAKTGKQLWRFHTVPGNPADGFENEAMEMAAQTWSGEWWKYGGGGTVWNAMTYDPDTHSIILGTGNGAPWNRRVRSEGKGDNLFLCSIIALDADTGEYKWHYQTNPGESWDYNSAMDMQLADLEIDGKPRKVVMTAPKNGFFYVIDRTNGKLISAEPLTKVTWAERIDLETGRPVEREGIRYEDGKTVVMWPGPNGGHNWLPMSFDPRTNIAYVPELQQPGTYNDRGIDPKAWKFTPGANDPAVNIDLTSNEPGAGTSEVVAYDVVNRKKLWTIPNPGFWNGGTMATAGNLLFQGHADGTFNAFSSRNGKKLWSFDAQTGVLAPPITYTVDGKQYVTVLSGFGVSGALFGDIVARFGWQYRSQPRRILTFSLDGTAKLPPAPARQELAPVSDPTFELDPDLAERGATVVGRRCIVCHGVDLKAAGIAPDLRVSPVPANAGAFDAVVRQGALVSRGMPAYPDVSKEDLDAARHYIRMKAREYAESRM